MQEPSPVYSDEWASPPYNSSYVQQYHGDGECWYQHQSYSPRTEFLYRGHMYPATDVFRQSRRSTFSSSHEPQDVYENQGAIPSYPDPVSLSRGHLSRSVSPDETEHSESSSVGWSQANLTPSLREPSSPELSIPRETSATELSYMCNFGNSLMQASDRGGMLSYAPGQPFVSPVNVSAPIGIPQTVDHFAGPDEFERQGFSIPFSSEGSYSNIKPFHGDHHHHMGMDGTQHFEDEYATLPTPPVSCPGSPAEDEEDADWNPRGARTSKRHAQAARSSSSSVLRPGNRAGRVTKSGYPKTNGLHPGKGLRSPHALAPNSTAADEKQQSGSSSGEKPKPFTCPLKPYGCQSRCASKNEWKRHISSQHFCVGYYRCDLCSDADTRPNDFNRKDLFTQHLRRMHHSTARLPFNQLEGPATPERKKKEAQAANAKKGSASSKAAGKSTGGHARRGGGDDDANGDSELEKCMDGIRDRCFKREREPPTTFRCAFCLEVFEGENCRDSWLEHVAKHMSSPAGNPTAKRVRRNDGTIDDGADGTPATSETVDWTVDEHLRAWLLQEKLLKPDGPHAFVLEKNSSK